MNKPILVSLKSDGYQIIIKKILINKTESKLCDPGVPSKLAASTIAQRIFGHKGRYHWRYFASTVKPCYVFLSFF